MKNCLIGFDFDGGTRLAGFSLGINVESLALIYLATSSTQTQRFVNVGVFAICESIVLRSLTLLLSSKTLEKLSLGPREKNLVLIVESINSIRDSFVSESGLLRSHSNRASHK